jgi:hypothetical protein
MKKLLALSAIVVMFSNFTHVSKVENQSAARTSASSKDAYTFTVNERFDMMSFNYIPCGGDIVSLSGQLHLLYHITVNGTRIIIKTGENYQGVSGTGFYTGDRYQATGGRQTTLSGVLAGGQFSYTAIREFNIIGQGSDNNYLVRAVFHLAVNAADLTLTSSLDKLTIECR